MSYDSVKNNLVSIMNSNGYTESDITNYEGLPALEYDNTFIIKSLSGEMGDNSETLSDRFYDVQDWEIQIAFSKSSQSDVINRDDVHRKKDDLISDIDKPSNWANTVRLQKYKSWKMEELKGYFLLTILVRIIDQYIYS